MSLFINIGRPSARPLGLGREMRASVAMRSFRVDYFPLLVQVGTFHFSTAMKIKRRICLYAYLLLCKTDISQDISRNTHNSQVSVHLPGACREPNLCQTVGSASWSCCSGRSGILAEAQIAV